jgi:hypothetical protein
MTIQQYIEKINTLYKTGNAREHSYRGDLQNLLMAILPDVLVTNEPAHVDCGAPDYVLTRKEIPIGYIETTVARISLRLSRNLRLVTSLQASRLSISLCAPESFLSGQVGVAAASSETK